MTTIVTRAGKGSPLTHAEVDTNFTNLNTNKLETAAIPLGTAAAPSISFLSDTNTGIFSPGADQVAVATNGVARVVVNNTGLGVGVPPSRSIDVYRGDAGQAILRLSDVDSRNVELRSPDGIGNQGSIGTVTNHDFIGLTGNTERLRITSTGTLNFKGAGTAGSTQAVSFNGSAPVNSLVIDSSGRLLVGTSTSPGGGAACILTDGYARFSKALGNKVTGSSYTVCTLSGLVAGKIKIISEHNAGVSYKEYSFCYSTNGKALSLIHDNSPYAPGAITLSLNNSTGVVSTSVLSYDTAITIVVECLGTTTSQINVVFP